MHLGITHKLGLAALCALCTFACGDGRDVQVSGEIAGADALAEGETLHLVVYEPDTAEVAEAEGDDAAATEQAEELYVIADEIELEALGSFDETVSVAGDSIYVVAFIDADGDGECSDGERWGDASAAVAEDDTATLDIALLADQACPAVPMAE